MIKHWFYRLVVGLLLVCQLSSIPKYNVQADLNKPLHGLNSAGQPIGTNQAVLPPGFQVVSSTPSTLILEIQSPPHNIETTNDGGYSCQRVKAEGYYQASTPGEPAILSTGVIFGIPLDSTPSLKIQSMETVTLHGQVHLCPVATPQIQQEQIGLPIEQGEVRSEDPIIYSKDAFLPNQPVEVVTIGMIRSQRVARLSFTPFMYNPFRDEIKLIRHVKVEVRLEISDATQHQPPMVDEGPFEPLLQKTLINYDQSRLWRAPHNLGTEQQIASAPLKPSESPQYKIQVDQDGLYQVTYTALHSAGVPVNDLNPHTFKLVNHGVEIPLYISGEADGEFNPGDYFLFYSQRTTTKYTNINVYWLSWGGENGLRMSTMDGTIHDASAPVSFSSSIHLEEDHRYVNDSPSGPQNDHWYWLVMRAISTPVSQDFTFSMHNLVVSPSTARIRGLLKGYYANPQHHTRIYLNGHLIDDQTWPSQSDYSFSVDIPQEYLVEGTNTITVECPRDGGITVDQVLVNWFEVDYANTFTADDNQLAFSWEQPGLWQFQVGGFISDTIDVLDIADPNAPIRILGATILPEGSTYQLSFERPIDGMHRFIALSPSSWMTPLAILLDSPSSLRDTTNGADYVIISHADFLDAIQPLATYRASSGLRVKVIDVQDVYDEFNAGVFSPQAIRDFLAYTYLNWIPPAPSYILLLGDGHYDFKNNYGDSGANFIPPYLGEFDPWIGETASDNRFVTISGDDILPDMTIGRLPANTPAETTAMVDKILSYERFLAHGDWNTRLTFVADNADNAGNFPVLSDNISASYLADTYAVDKVYYGLDPYISAAETRTAILESINQGRLIINFIGHGSVQYWAAENLFHVDSIAGLVNAGKYSFFVPMTCAEGYFVIPPATGFKKPSLAESLVRASEKGAIASFSPSGFGLSIGHDLLAHGLYQALFNDGLTQFGPATTFAKFYLSANTTDFDDLIDTYNLLGDPATQLKIPTPYSISLPLIIH